MAPASSAFDDTKKCRLPRSRWHWASAGDLDRLLWHERKLVETAGMRCQNPHALSPLLPQTIPQGDGFEQETGHTA
jgi:hypothetical protein